MNTYDSWRLATPPEYDEEARLNALFPEKETELEELLSKNGWGEFLSLIRGTDLWVEGIENQLRTGF